MIKKTAMALSTVLLLSLGTEAQNFELDQVRQIPSIDENNMKIIAFSIAKLFDQAIQGPEKNSSIKAVSETVYSYYDIDYDGKLDKLNPLNGKQYSPSEQQELQKNNRLLFNLTFGESGKLIVPDKIYVISHREEKQPDRTIEKVGLLAFELEVKDEIKNELNGVRLQNMAKTDINSLTGELKPVKIKLPLNLSWSDPGKETVEGEVKIKKGQVQVYLSGKSRFQEKATEILKSQTELLEYKKGKFSFTIDEEARGYHIDINIMRDMAYSSQPKSFTIKTYTVSKFEGNGKK